MNTVAVDTISVMIGYPTMLLCRQDFNTWQVIPRRGPGGWEFGQGEVLHLHYAPHSLNAPLVLDAPIPDNPVTHGSTIPVCARCLFHAYPPEIFTMPSVHTARGQERWGLPWRRSTTHVIGGELRHGGHYWGDASMWHMHTHYTSTVDVGAEQYVTVGGIGPVATLEEVTADNTGAVCAQCLVQIFPELEASALWPRPRPTPPRAWCGTS